MSFWKTRKFRARLLIVLCFGLVLVGGYLINSQVQRARETVYNTYLNSNISDQQRNDAMDQFYEIKDKVYLLQMGLIFTLGWLAPLLTTNICDQSAENRAKESGEAIKP